MAELPPEMRHAAEALVRAFLLRYPLQDEAEVRAALTAFLLALGAEDWLFLVMRINYDLPRKLHDLADDFDDPLGPERAGIRRVNFRAFDVEELTR